MEKIINFKSCIILADILNIFIQTGYFCLLINATAEFDHSVIVYKKILLYLLPIDNPDDFVTQNDIHAAK